MIRNRWWLAGLVLVASPASGQRETADDPLFAARQALATGRYDQAIAAFDRLSRNRPEASVWAVRARLEVGRYVEAEERGRELVTESPTTPGAWLAFGDALLRRGRRTEAERALRRATTAGGSDSLVAELRLAQLLYDRGDTPAAFRRLDGFIDVYNSRRGLSSEELTAVATAARFLAVETWGLFHDAERVYKEAIAKDSRNFDARVRLGDLYLSKYDNKDAQPTFQEALTLNPSHPDALLGLAQSQHFDGSAEALETTKKSIEGNPNLVEARVFLARLYLELEEYGLAAAAAERALEVDSGSLDALSMLAAVRYLTGDEAGFAEVERQVLRLNPRYAEFYATLADVSARNRLYAEAAEFARHGFELDSTSWRTLGLLGMNQLRTGAIDEGRANLDKAFAADPFNVWIKNTLDLTDTFTEYTVVDTDRFRLVLHEDEADLLAPYVAEVAEDVYERLAARYGYRPPTPIRVEVYPRHADFSVRTVGLAGLGALGVSFGPVVAMDSPSAREIGQFNWGSTLWHEVAHTFHLGMTGHKVPRWFTEGLAVYEERRARRGWGDDVTIGFLAAYRDGRLLPVSELNNGFVRPSYPGQVIHSYYQASLVCELIERDFGARGLLNMLDGFRAGGSSAEVIEDVLGMEINRFDREFDTYLQTRFVGALTAIGGMAAGPSERPSAADASRRARRDRNDFAAQMAAGRAMFENGRLDEAIPFFQRAQELFPEYGEGNSPYWFLAGIYKENGMIRKAADQLTALTAINANQYEAFIGLSDLREQLGELSSAAAALAQALYVYPFAIPVHERLATLYGQIGEGAAAVRERRAVVALDPVDLPEARYQLAHALMRTGDLGAARREVLRTLEVAPNFAKAQDLLLEIRSKRR